MRILIAGSAGFIGSALAERLASEGHVVMGIDNLSDYYSTDLKIDRLKRGGIDLNVSNVSMIYPNLSYRNTDICDSGALVETFNEFRPEAVVNLAARPGVRCSIDVPDETVRTNILGFFNMLEASRKAQVKHFLYASSSSVYGDNPRTPFRETDDCRNPLSIYAATKLSNEIMAGAYSKAYGMCTTGVRMFSVYGPWGRPDMAPVIFTKALYEGEKIHLFGGGSQTRDFTYIDDVVESLARLLLLTGHPGESEIYNIGSGCPIQIKEFLHKLEKATARRSEIVTDLEQRGEARRTFADSDKLRGAIGYRTFLPLNDGIAKLVEWMKEYYKF